MKRTNSQLLIAAICLLVGVLVLAQYRSQKLLARSDVPSSTNDQAAYISQLYDSNTQLQQQVSDLQSKLGQYHSDGSNGVSSMESLERDLQSVRMANGEVEA